MPEPRGHDNFRLGPGAIMLAIAIKYFGLTVYGIHAAFVLVPSFVDVGGSIFAFLWACTITVLSALALAAVIRTWFTNRYRLEKFATAALILGFLTYSIVLVVRGILLGSWGAIPLAWLPLILVVFPAIRYYDLVFRKALWDE